MVRICRKKPNEWEKYEPIGQVIANTRIFAFKTPLKLELQTRLDKTEKFSTMELYRRLAESGKTLGLVINATNTERYYDRADVEGMYIKYKVLLCPGRGFLDQTDLVMHFLQTVNEFLMDNQENDLLIGVHCTNGVNRTGYLICRYLIDKLGWSSHQALEAFENARGYPIERGSYVQALHKADRENRLKKKNAFNMIETNEVTADGEFQENEEEEQSEKERKRKRKRRKEMEKNADGEQDAAEMQSFDPTLTAQMMQQFFQMEQQFKEAAQVAVVDKQFQSPFQPSSLPTANQAKAKPKPNPKHQFAIPSTVASSSNIFDKNTSNRKNKIVSSATILETKLVVEDQLEDIDDDSAEDEEISTANIDFESMGKIDVVEVSASQQRRQRRKKLEKKFATMKRGKFWEINELRKDGGF